MVYDAVEKIKYSNSNLTDISSIQEQSKSFPLI